jgi:membrane protease YdiL (CAAX protease family)
VIPEVRQEDLPTPPWDVGDIVRAVLLSVAFIVAAIVVILAAGALLRWAGVSLARSRVAVTVVLLLVQNASFLVGIWVFGLRKHHSGPTQLGLRPYVPAAGCGAATLGLALSLGFNAVYNALVLGGPAQQTPVLPLFGSGVAGLAVALLVASIVVPFAEEMFFRGFLYPGLARRLGLVTGALVSSVIFGAAHLNVDTFIPLSVFGFILAMLYSATGSIFPGIMLHSVNNSLALLAAYLLEAGLLPPH